MFAKFGTRDLTRVTMVHHSSQEILQSLQRKKDFTITVLPQDTHAQTGKDNPKDITINRKDQACKDQMIYNLHKRNTKDHNFTTGDHVLLKQKTETKIFDSFEIFLKKCDVESKELLIIGDINCNILKSPRDTNTNKLMFLKALYNLEQLIKEPTRVTNTSSSLIDLILTNHPNNISNSGLNYLGISDHSLIYAVKKRVYQNVDKLDPKFEILRDLMKLTLSRNYQVYPGM